MEAFAERQHDENLRERLEQAIEGKGAFNRFLNVIHDEDLSDQWHTFSTPTGRWDVPASSLPITVFA